MMPDNFTVKSFYWRAFNDYMEACDQITDLYDNQKTPGVHEHAMAETRYRHALDKLRFLINISRVKYGIMLDPVPQLLLRGGIA